MNLRILRPQHKSLIIDHLVSLDPESRYSRFGCAISSTRIARFIEGIDMDKHEFRAILTRKNEIAALSQLSMINEQEVEFGVSVSDSWRGRGFGKMLLAHALVMSKARNIEKLHVNYLRTNSAMKKIVSLLPAKRKTDAGMTYAEINTREARLDRLLSPGKDMSINKSKLQQDQFISC